jgi:glycosyltransferase involved in cell wall biosynthesis
LSVFDCVKGPVAKIEAAVARRSPPKQVSSGRRDDAAARFLDAVKPSMYDVVASGGHGDEALQVSVVVPTYNRCDLLADTLRALTDQDMPGGSYEVLVIDNASTDNTTSLLREVAGTAKIPFTGIRSKRNRGPAVSRNIGVLNARGRILAFTDSDCVPTRGWLGSLVGAFTEGVGAVQGRTEAHPQQSQPLFNHFIETHEFDGSYSTANVAYLREAVIATGGFDPGCSYWEDVDLGWRVHRANWRSVFSDDALVYHQVLRLSAASWILSAMRYHVWPAKAARYPEFGRYLILGLWSNRQHPLFQAFALGAVLSAWRRPFLLLTLPYLLLPLRRRLIGRWPILRAAAYVMRDAVALAALIAGSIRFRRPVL